MYLGLVKQVEKKGKTRKPQRQTSSVAMNKRGWSSAHPQSLTQGLNK